jgi:hypothetical protein
MSEHTAILIVNLIEQQQQQAREKAVEETTNRLRLEGEKRAAERARQSSQVKTSSG